MWWISEIESLQTEGEQCFSEYLLRFGVVLTLAEKRKIPHEHLSFTFALLAGSMSKRICTNAIESIEPVHTRSENEMYRFLSVWAILSSTRITYFDHVTDLLEQFGISTIAASNENVNRSVRWAGILLSIGTDDDVSVHSSYGCSFYRCQSSGTNTEFYTQKMIVCIQLWNIPNRIEWEIAKLIKMKYRNKLNENWLQYVHFAYLIVLLLSYNVSVKIKDGALFTHSQACS